MRGPDSLERYLAVLFGAARPTTLIEVRWRAGGGMRRTFTPADDVAGVAAAVTSLGGERDVYVGALPRYRRRGGRDAVVGDARTVWVDLDTSKGEERLAAFAPPPRMVVRSGGPGHLHAYWTLRRAITPGQVERANRRLAWALGADLGSTDAARILRPPGTLNHMRDGARVALIGGPGGEPVGWRELVGALPDPPADVVPARGRRASRRGRDGLLAVEPELYVSVLTGQRVGRSRKVTCPLHEDKVPSLHVYDDPARGWFCFGCRRGGSVYDLAAAVWKIEPRRSGFIALREGLGAALDHGPQG